MKSLIFHSLRLLILGLSLDLILGLTLGSPFAIAKIVNRGFPKNSSPSEGFSSQPMAKTTEQKILDFAPAPKIRATLVDQKETQTKSESNTRSSSTEESVEMPKPKCFVPIKSTSDISINTIEVAFAKKVTDAVEDSTFYDLLKKIFDCGDDSGKLTDKKINELNDYLEKFHQSFFKSLLSKGDMNNEAYKRRQGLLFSLRGRPEFKRLHFIFEKEKDSIGIKKNIFEKLSAINDYTPPNEESGGEDQNNQKETEEKAKANEKVKDKEWLKKEEEIFKYHSKYLKYREYMDEKCAKPVKDHNKCYNATQQYYLIGKNKYLKKMYELIFHLQKDATDEKKKEIEEDQKYYLGNPEEQFEKIKLEMKGQNQQWDEGFAMGNTGGANYRSPPYSASLGSLNSPNFFSNSNVLIH